MPTLITIDLLQGKLTQQPTQVLGEPEIHKDSLFGTEIIEGHIESFLNLQVGKSVDLSQDGVSFRLGSHFDVLVALSFNPAENKLNWYLDQDYLDGLSTHEVTLNGAELMLSSLNSEHLSNIKPSSPNSEQIALHELEREGFYYLTCSTPSAADLVDNEPLNIEKLNLIVDAHINEIGLNNIMALLKQNNSL